MADVQINEVHTDIEVTESVGTLSPAEVKRLVALVMAQLEARRIHEERRAQDNRLRNSAYVSDLTD